jgi:hypothetical protein
MTTATALTTTNNEPPTMALIQMAMDKDMDADERRTGRLSANSPRR